MQHPYGSFCFAEVHTPDVEGAKRFYGELFGWRAVGVPGASDYFMFQLQGKDIIALRRSPGPHRLVGYVHVENVDDTVARAKELGATVATPVFETPAIARTCVLADPEGATFGLWEPRGHGGAHVQNQTGTMWWVELLARDINAARRFYMELFGWSFEETQKYGIDLTIFRVGTESVGGAVQYGPDWGVTERWQVYFAVDDWVTAVKRTMALDGELEFWRDVPNVGRLGMIRDPAGAVFCIMRLNPAPAATGI